MNGSWDPAGQTQGRYRKGRGLGREIQEGAGSWEGDTGKGGVWGEAGGWLLAATDVVSPHSKNYKMMKHAVTCMYSSEVLQTQFSSKSLTQIISYRANGFSFISPN